MLPTFIPASSPFSFLASFPFLCSPLPFPCHKVALHFRCGSAGFFPGYVYLGILLWASFKTFSLTKIDLYPSEFLSKFIKKLVIIIFVKHNISHSSTYGSEFKIIDLVFYVNQFDSIIHYIV